MPPLVDNASSLKKYGRCAESATQSLSLKFSIRLIIVTTTHTLQKGQLLEKRRKRTKIPSRNQTKNTNDTVISSRYVQHLMFNIGSETRLFLVISYLSLLACKLILIDLLQLQYGFYCNQSRNNISKYFLLYFH